MQWRLAAVVTETWDTTTASYAAVDQWDLTHTFPDPGDGTTPSLWLQSIQHTGLAGGSLAEPATTFGGGAFANTAEAGLPANKRFRLGGITSGTGEQVVIYYSGPECPAPRPVPDVNPHRCYPAYSSDAGRFVYWHKYLAAAVAVRDLTGGGPEQLTRYEFSVAADVSNTTALWHYDDDESTPGSRRSWSQWRGYTKVTARTGPDGGPHLVSDKLFYRGMNGDRTFAGGYRWGAIYTVHGDALLDEGPLQGFLREETTLDGTVAAASTVHRPALTRTAVSTRPWLTTEGWRIREDETRHRTRLNHNNTYRWTKTTAQFDSYGLPTTAIDHGDEAVSGDESCTTTTYARNTSPYLIAYPAQVAMRTGTGCGTTGTRLAQARTFYDNTTTLGAAPTKGLPTKAQNLVSVGPDVWASTEAGYDIHGRQTSAKDARGQTSTTAYTPATGGPLRQVTSTNPLGHSSTTTLDPRRGVPTTVVDANGKTTTAAYDPLGRLLKVWRPGRPTNGTPDVEYTYTLRDTGANAITTKELGPTGNQITSYELFDGRLRPRQTQDPAPQANGGRIITDIQYDARWLVVKSSRLWNNTSGPTDVLAGFTDADAKTQTRTVYDNLARVTAAQTWSANALKWQTSTAYDGDRVMVTPPAGGTATTTLSNAQGKAVELRQHLTGSTAGAFQATTYEYDRMQRLTKVTDPAGNAWSTTYDTAGRVTSQVDPDKGTTTMSYNPAGDLLTSTDGRGIVLSYGYDNLGRKTSLWQGPVGSGTKRSEWTYDTLTGGGTVNGQLTKSTRWKTSTEAYSSEVTGFDDQYRALGVTVRLPATESTLAGPWTTSTTYNVDGSVATQTYPAAGSLPTETITTTYDNTGYALTQAGLDTYVSATTYYPWGDTSQRTLGTGTKRIQLQATIDEATGRLVENRTSTENQTTPGAWVPQLIEQYGHDAAGNVRNIKEVNGSGTTISNQCFTYDPLRQLTEAWTTTAATCQTTPTQSTVGGPDSYWSSYRYNTIGNRTQDIVQKPTGDTTRSYTYPASGAAAVRPHAVQTVTATGAAPGTDTYGYDNTGNTTARNLAGKPGQTLTWDPEGHLATVTDSAGTTSYLYTPEGQRLLAVEPGGTTLYLGAVELRRTTTGVTCTRHYGTAVRTTAGGLKWQAADHHNTGQLTIDPASLTVTRRKSDPFGKPRGTTPPWPSTRGFLDGTADATGLTHLGAREYEPDTGRFISVDPIMDLADPVQMNGYAYANSNPTSGSDPDGTKYCIDECGGEADRYLTAIANAARANQAAGKDWSARHNAATRQARVAIMNQCLPCVVRIEVAVPGGSKNKTGNDGYADIVACDLWTHECFIWEVKQKSKSTDKPTGAAADGPGHLRGYMEQLRGPLREQGYSIEEGWDLRGTDGGRLYQPDPENPKESLLVTNSAGNEGYDPVTFRGVIVYWTEPRGDQDGSLPEYPNNEAEYHDNKMKNGQKYGDDRVMPYTLWDFVTKGPPPPAAPATSSNDQKKKKKPADCWCTW